MKILLGFTLMGISAANWFNTILLTNAIVRLSHAYGFAAFYFITSMICTFILLQNGLKIITRDV